MSEKKLYWKHRPRGDSPWATVEKIEDVEEMMREGLACDPDQVWEVQPVWMTPEEFAALGEFTGW